MERYLMLYLICNTRYENNEEFKRGTFIFGWNQLSNETGISIQTLRTIIPKLERLNLLTSQLTSKGHLLTITDYDSYVSFAESTNKPTNKQLTSNQQGTNKELTPWDQDKEYKEDKEDKESSGPAATTHNKITIIEKDKRELLLMDVTDANSFLQFYAEIFKRIGFKRAELTGGEQLQAEEYYASLIVEGSVVTPDSLKASVYNYVATHCLNAASKHKYLHKRPNPVMLWTKVLCGYLISHGIVKNSEKEKEESLDEIAARYGLKRKIN
jgi:hypothetical protein